MVAPADPMLKGKSPDMGSLRPKKGTAKKTQQQMQPVEIIKQSVSQEMPGANPDQIVGTLGAMVERGVVKLLQIGNTVFSVIPKSKDIAEFHTFTIEDPQTLVQRFKAGANSLKQMGFKQAVTYAESPAFVKMAQQTGLPVKIAQGQQTIGGQAKPTYQFVLDL